MSQFRRFCIFLLVLGGLQLVNGNVSISGCIGELATLYEGVLFNSDNIVFNLYKNGDSNILLAMWSKQNSDPVKESYENGYGKKLSLENGTIRIHNLSKSDEGKYIIQPALGAWSIKIEVYLVVLVAPPEQCIPNITRVQKEFVASLDIEDCGNPAAHVSWYKVGANNTSRPVRELNTWELKGKTISKLVIRKEADMYCACAESSAMHCVRRHDRFDLCSCLKTEKGKIHENACSELSDWTNITKEIHVEWKELPGLIIIIALSIVTIISIVAVIVTSIILHRRCKVTSPSGNSAVLLEMKPLHAQEQPPKQLYRLLDTIIR